MSGEILKWYLVSYSFQTATAHGMNCTHFGFREGIRESTLNEILETCKADTASLRDEEVLSVSLYAISFLCEMTEEDFYQ